jgi:hypothetical protein
MNNMSHLKNVIIVWETQRSHKNTPQIANLKTEVHDCMRHEVQH